MHSVFMECLLQSNGFHMSHSLFFFLIYASSKFVKLMHYLFYESEQDKWLAWIM